MGILFYIQQQQSYLFYLLHQLWPTISLTNQEHIDQQYLWRTKNILVDCVHQHIHLMMDLNWGKARKTSTAPHLYICSHRGLEDVKLHFSEFSNQNISKKDSYSLWDTIKTNGCIVSSLVPRYEWIWYTIPRKLFPLSPVLVGPLAT